MPFSCFITERPHQPASQGYAEDFLQNPFQKNAGPDKSPTSSGGFHERTNPHFAPTHSVVSFTLAAEGDQPKFKVTTKRKDDTVEVRADKDKALFVVKSPFGISHAVIERVDEKWPDVVALHLHLKGLESFKGSNGKVTLDAAVSVHEGKPKVRLWKDGKEDAPLDDKSPFWTDIRIVDGDGKPVREFPLKDGYFEVPLPMAFFKGNPKTITVGWIDFYRN